MCSSNAIKICGNQDLSSAPETGDLRAVFERNGYLILPRVFAEEETEQLKQHYMELRGKGTYPGDFAGVSLSAQDPLAQYPRMIHMHRWDDVSLRWLLDRRLGAAMERMLGREPCAVQTMLYFKPPGARGQALHQDQFYLRAFPGTCVAAWLALDRCDEQNGCMRVVPGSHEWPLLCLQKADTTQSFTDVTVDLPPGATATPVEMNPGDVLFFTGTLVHGSYPNDSADRFRRALIGHYVTAEAERVGEFYHPIYRMDGSIAELGRSMDSGPCGRWVDHDGLAVVEMAEAIRTEAHE